MASSSPVPPLDLATLGSLPTPSPWACRDTWCYSIIELPVKLHPFTHNAYAERVTAAGNYIGRELGPMTSRGLAERAVAAHAEACAGGEGGPHGRPVVRPTISG